MYSYFKGTVQEIYDTNMVFEVNDIGYFINISKRDAIYFQNYLNQPTQIYIYQHIKEDSNALYGFSTKQAKEIFMIVITISGIGPKIGLAILSDLDIDQLISAVLTNNLIPLTSVSGIGKKTAERMMIELKDKFSHLETPVLSDTEKSSSAISRKLEQEVKEALTALGYNHSEIKKMLNHILDQITPETKLEEIITLALRFR